MPRKHDAVKVALADMVSGAVKFALDFRAMSVSPPQHEPLNEYHLELVPISDLEFLIRATGHGRERYFSVKVSEDRK